MNARRQIFRLLMANPRPVSTADLCRATGLTVGTVANVCSAFETTGIAHRPDGPRKGYTLRVDMLPEDREALAVLVDTYGRGFLKREVSHG